ncbi:hypothetical protein [Pseudobutyrivibrio sp. 49]|uniref:hypothetical protein n=1 Tax=Pseudobutyrivibrio sp. 49 TaxID=1855344 RepID=UPI000B7FBB43|nr:hypothetical protein [Pseudobutyrivibrio sp. 49]
MNEIEQLVETAINDITKISKPKELPLASDIRLLKGIIGKLPKRYNQLNRPIERLSPEKIQKAKSNYHQFNLIKKRHPELVSQEVDRLYSGLVVLIIRAEVALIMGLINRKNRLSTDDVLVVLRNEKERRKVLQQPLKDVILAYYRRNGFPWEIRDINTQVVTVFIDETIKPSPLDQFYTVGMFSYIICEGNIKKEKRMDTRIIESGIQPSAEIVHVELITIEAMEYVLFKLLSKYHYHGKVVFKIDSQAAQKRWIDEKYAYGIVNQFKSITISRIPRTGNTRADKLCRQYSIVTIKNDSINQAKNKVARINTAQIKPAKNNPIRDFIRRII